LPIKNRLLAKARPNQKFLNCDPKTNIQLVQLVGDSTEFRPANTRFVVNAGELSNQALYDALYAQKETVATVDAIPQQ
jgi:hypothetical protein